MSRLPTSSLLALLAAAVAFVPAATAAATAGDPATAAGAVLALVLPYLVVAVALRGRTVVSKGVGVGTGALMTWLTSYAVIEAAAGMYRGDPVRAASIPFLVLTILGLVIVGVGVSDLRAAVHATGWWMRTPAAARLALLAAAYWTLVFTADTYLTANPPLARMLLAPSLALVNLVAGLMLRSPRRAATVAGTLMAAGAVVATAACWVVEASYLSMGGPPAVPEYTYFTLLPWPVLLSLSLALDAAAAATAVGMLRWRRESASPR
jgi:hypothetical protein